MKLKQELVSILLPVQNAARFLPQCLESLKAQSYQDIQVIAIDDFSSDESYTILKQFKKHFKQLEIHRNKKRYGIAVCYNRALKRAQGQFIAFMNPHDVNTENRLKRQVSFLQKNPKTVAVGTQYHSIDEQNRKRERSNLPQEHEMIYDKAIHASSFLPETVMINRERLPKDLLYFKHNKYPFVFTEVFLKFFTYGTVANIAHALYYHREGMKRPGRKITRIKQVQAMMQLWMQAKRYNSTAPSLRSFFPQLVRGL